MTRPALMPWMLATTALAVGQPAAADDAAKPDTTSQVAKILADYSVDLAIPDTPGLTIVGLNAENVIRPATPRKLGMALMQGRGTDGTLKQGFALDFAPAKLLAPMMSKKEYRDSPFVARPWWNAQISFGAGQPLSDKDKSSRMGLGISSVIWRADSTDPLVNTDHEACLQKALFTTLPDSMPKLDGGNGGAKAAATPAKPANKEATADKPAGDTPTISQCHEKFEKMSWNSSAILLGWATARISGRDPALLPDASPRGFWISFNYGFDQLPSLQPFLQLTATHRRLKDEIVADPTDETKFVARESRFTGVKLYGKSDIANLFIEASRQRSTITGRDPENSTLYVLGAEKKLSDNLWLSLAMGRKRGGTDANPTTISTGLKYGLQEKPYIK